jgi:hypothetical protein
MLYLIYIIYYVNIYCYILNFIVKLGLFLLIRTASKTTGAPVISSLGVQMATDKLSVDSSTGYLYPRPSSHIRTHICCPQRGTKPCPYPTDIRGYIRLPVRINNIYNNSF